MSVGFPGASSHSSRRGIFASKEPRVKAKPTFRRHLLTIAFLLLLPPIAVAAILVYRLTGEQLTAAKRAVESEAIALANIVDLEFARRYEQLTVIIDRPVGALENIEVAAALNSVVAVDGLSVIVRAATPEARALVGMKASEPFDRRKGSPRVSPVFRNGQGWAIAVWKPWVRGDHAYIVTLVMPVEHVASIVHLAFDRGPAWRWGITDANRMFIARSVEHEKFVGTDLHPELVAASQDRSGSSEETSVDGSVILRGYAKTRSGDMMIAVAVPRAEIDLSAQRLWFIFAIVAIGALCALLGLAYRLSSILASSIGHLTADASLLGDGGTLAPRSLPVSELQEVHDALSRAAAAREASAADTQLLLRELEHRTKNLLAVVLSLADRTLRDASDVNTARMQLRGRLRALANATEQLSKSSWKGACIRLIVEQSLEPFASQCRSDGPRLQLTPLSTTNLALILHELMTNAVKHGALSVREGTVEVRWDIEGDKFTFEWREANGPVVVAPQKEGFGTRLLQAASMGSVPPKLDYAPDGFRCKLWVPLTQIVVAP